MPHTSHKNRVLRYDKRRHVEANDGWTHVIKGPAQNDFHRLAESMPQGLRPTEIPRGLTLDHWKTRFRRVQEDWYESSCCRDVKSFFQETLLKLDSLKITSCVCLGLGSFTASRHPYCPGSPRSSQYQLAALEMWLDLLSKLCLPMLSRCPELIVRNRRETCHHPRLLPRSSPQQP